MMIKVMSGILSFVLCLTVLYTSTNTFDVDRASAADIELWRIGNINSSYSEFSLSGSGAKTYTIPSNWSTKTSWTDFEGKWETSSGNNISYTINFELTSVPSNAYLQIAVADADNETSAYRIRVNGNDLQVKWIGGRDNKISTTGPGPSLDGVVSLHWPIPVSALVSGSNSIQIYSPLQNTGNSMTAGGDKGTILLDYLRLMSGTKNVYKPMDRGVGAWWMTPEMNQYARSMNFGGARGVEGVLEYYSGTFDNDLALLKKMGINYVYTSIMWPVIERSGKGDFHQASIDEYHRILKALRDAGIKTWVDIQYTPQWASSQPTKTGDLGYEDYPPANWQDWNDIVQFIATTYGDVVDNWLIYNEQDGNLFWGGSYAEYLELFNRAHTVLTQYDTIDADGDGVAMSVAPGGYEMDDGSSTTDYAYQLERDAGSKFNSVHYHDYNWGNLSRNSSYYNLSPNKKIYVDEFGSGYWTDQTQQAYEQESGSWRADYPTNPPYAHENYDEIRYLAWFQEPDIHVDGYAAFSFKGDIDKDVDFCNCGGQYDYGNAWVETEPGTPYTYYMHPGGATAQHLHWLYKYNNYLYPVISQHSDSARVLVDAVRDGSNIQIVATNIEYHQGPSHAVTIQVPVSGSSLTLNKYDPYTLLSSQSVSASNGYVTINATLSADPLTRTVRYEIVGGAQ